MAEWISIKDRLPLEDEVVLLYAPGTRVTGGQFHIGRWGSSEKMWMSQDGRVESTKDWFTHWMPLPKPPTKQEQTTVVVDIHVNGERIDVDSFAEMVTEAMREIR